MQAGNGGSGSLLFQPQRLPQRLVLRHLCHHLRTSRRERRGSNMQRKPLTRLLLLCVLQFGSVWQSRSPNRAGPLGSCLPSPPGRARPPACAAAAHAVPPPVGSRAGRGEAPQFTPSDSTPDSGMIAAAQLCQDICHSTVNPLRHLLRCLKLGPGRRLGGAGAAGARGPQVLFPPRACRAGMGLMARHSVRLAPCASGHMQLKPQRHMQWVAGSCIACW